MTSFSSNLHQIIFATKGRKRCLTKENRAELYRYFGQTCVNKQCHPIVINGIEDHVHILLSVHSKVAIADLIKSLKTSSHSAIKELNWFPNFDGWQVGYGHFTYSTEARPKLVAYINNQEEHHTKFDSKEELLKLLKRHGVEVDLKYFE